MGEIRASGEIRLLKFLVQCGRVTPQVARDAELAATTDKKSVIEWLAQNRILDEEDLARLLAERLRVPYVNLAAVALDPTVLELVREELATRHRVVPLRAGGSTLILATANPLDCDAIRAIEFATGRRAQLEVATATAIRDALEHAYHLEIALDAYLKLVPDESEQLPVAELCEENADVKSLLRGTTLPPIVKLFNLILLEGVRTGASDIHVEPGVSAVQVRYRTNGLLEESFKLPKWVQAPLIARCKVMAALDITERRVPQDGRIRLRFHDAMLDLRVSSLPTQFGEKLTMRILDGGATTVGLDKLNLSPRDLKCIRQAITRPEGLILVTGPTGSGKSTTLYSMIMAILSPTRNIVTIENPIEYQIRGVNQVEINEKQGLTFAGALRSILRQDPDVILLGEIRDRETAEIALRAAQTGHLVLSTLHTNDAVATVSRVLDLGIEPYMVASSLHLIVAQRLVRRNCPHCIEPYDPDPQALRALEIDPHGKTFRRGRGCAACRKSGFAGRMAILQVMPITPALAKLIESKAPDSAIRSQTREDGTRSLHEDAAVKVCEGLTTAEEVLRVVDVPNEESRCPSCARTVEQTFTMCPHCGTPLHSNCASCGMKLQKEWLICPYCGAGAKLPAVAVTAAPVPVVAGPVSTASVAPTNAPPSRMTRDTAPATYRALVVDDQPDMRRLITFTLENSGLPISVVAAASGAEALERAQETPPDLILLDIMMPEMDGFQVCEHLRNTVRTAFIPILMLTALDDPGNRARGFLAGTDDYIGKPFARAELIARVRRLLQRTYGLTANLPVSALHGEGEDANPMLLSA